MSVLSAYQETVGLSEAVVAGAAGILGTLEDVSPRLLHRPKSETPGVPSHHCPRTAQGGLRAKTSERGRPDTRTYCTLQVPYSVLMSLALVCWVCCWCSWWLVCWAWCWCCWRCVVASTVNLRLDEVLVEGYGPFRSATVYPLRARGLRIVSGLNEDSSGSDSNGAGKTSLVMAPLWALTGSTDSRVPGSTYKGWVWGSGFVGPLGCTLCGRVKAAGAEPVAEAEAEAEAEKTIGRRFFMAPSCSSWVRLSCMPCAVLCWVLLWCAVLCWAVGRGGRAG